MTTYTMHSSQECSFDQIAQFVKGFREMTVSVDMVRQDVDCHRQLQSDQAQKLAKELYDAVVVRKERIMLGHHMCISSPVAPDSILMIKAPEPMRVGILPPPLEWDSSPGPIRWRLDYGIRPRDYMRSMFYADCGTLDRVPGEWRRYGTKQRPVRANKRRRLARRFPLQVNYQKRHRRALAAQKLFGKSVRANAAVGQAGP